MKSGVKKGSGNVVSVSSAGRELTLHLNHDTKRPQHTRVYHISAFNEATAKDWAEAIKTNVNYFRSQTE